MAVVADIRSEYQKVLVRISGGDGRHETGLSDAWGS